MLSKLLLSCVVVGCFSVPVMAQDSDNVKVETDRFTGRTSVSVKQPVFMPSHGNVSFTAIAIKEKDRDAGITSVGFFSYNEDWQYLSCNSIYFLVDGKPFKYMFTDHENKVLSGRVLENHRVFFTIKQFHELANSKKVEMKICNDEFEFSPEFMNDLRTISAKLRK
jgi:hypothetical protein